MGLRFRKSKKIGPFRVNFSKSGIGYSYGNKYARVTHTADGKKRTTYTIPGTGVSWVEAEGNKKKESAKAEYEDSAERRGGSGCLTWILFIAAALFICFLAFGGNEVSDTTDFSKNKIEQTTAKEGPSSLSFRAIGASKAETSNETIYTTDSVEERATAATTAPPTEETTQSTTEATTQSTAAPAEEQFIVNTNTKKFHHIWCGSAPDSGSKSFWLTTTTRDSLEQRGYTPCKKCF